MTVDDGDDGLAGLIGGIALLSEGVVFLRRHRRLWLLTAVPVVLATLAVGTAAAVFWLQLETVHRLLVEVLPQLEAGAWWTWLWVGPGRALFFVLGWLGVVVGFAVALVAALLLASLLSAPFLDLLSQRVERIVTGVVPPSGAGLLREVVRSFVAELQRVAFLGAVWLVLTLAGFLVPGAHLVTGPLLVGVTILFLPLDYAGFALDRRGVPFAVRRRWLRARLPTMVGFGGVAFLACLVPGLNLVVTPSLVTAGTLLVLRAGPAPEAARD
jgi:CysZ protein